MHTGFFGRIRPSDRTSPSIGWGMVQLRHHLLTAMSQSVTINENGKRKKISKIAAAVTQLANDAARGDKKSIQLTFA